MSDPQHAALVVLSVVQLVLLFVVIAGVVYLAWRVHRIDTYIDRSK